jgi:hypothetical protein
LPNGTNTRTRPYSKRPPSNLTPSKSEPAEDTSTDPSLPGNRPLTTKLLPNVPIKPQQKLERNIPRKLLELQENHTRDHTRKLRKHQRKERKQQRKLLRNQRKLKMLKEKLPKLL